MLTLPPGGARPSGACVRHRWREIRTTDFFQLLNAVATGLADGMYDQQKAYELMRDGPQATFDPAELTQLGDAGNAA